MSEFEPSATRPTSEPMVLIDSAPNTRLLWTNVVLGVSAVLLVVAVA